MTLRATLEYGEYFTVDTDEWVSDTVGDRDDALTESLGEFLADAGSDHTETIMAWLATVGPDDDDDTDDDGSPVWTGVYGDGEPWSVYSGNQESFLTTEIQVILAYSRARSLVLVSHADAYGTHGHPDVYDVSGPGDEHLSILEFGRLTAVCSAGHVSDSENAGYDWHGDNGGDGVGWWASRNVRIDTMVRAYDDCDDDTRYVECPAPECYHAVAVWTY